MITCSLIVTILSSVSFDVLPRNFFRLNNDFVRWVKLVAWFKTVHLHCQYARQSSVQMQAVTTRRLIHTAEK